MIRRLPQPRSASPGTSRDAERRTRRGGPPAGRQRRSLSHLGGRVRWTGDARLAHDLASALDTGDDDGRALTHGFHAYPARMHPRTARRILEARLATAAAPEGAPPIVVDPFCGSGSVAVESLRAGAQFVGGDISPVALEVAWVRTRVWPAKRCRQVETRASRAARMAEDLAREDRRPPPWIRTESSWYDPPALRDVWALGDAIETEDDPDLRRVLRMVLSSILVKVSRQVSDATTVRDRDHRRVGAGTAIRLFTRRAHELAGRLDALREDLRAHGTHPCEPRLEQADARAGGLVARASASLILSSPPYLGTYDYLFHHARRYAALGLPTEFADRHEIGARRRVRAGPHAAATSYARDLAEALSRMRSALAPGGGIVLLLGDGTVGSEIIRADELLSRIAPRAGLEIAAVASQQRPNWLTGKGAPSRAEHLVELRRG